jgi:hypothetical protein
LKKSDVALPLITLLAKNVEEEAKNGFKSEENVLSSHLGLAKLN